MSKKENVRFVADYLVKGGSPFRKLPKHRFTKVLGAGTYGAAIEMKKGKDKVVVKISDPRHPEEYSREVSILKKLDCSKNNIPCFRAELSFPVINAYAMTSSKNAITLHEFYIKLLEKTHKNSSTAQYIETIDCFFGSVCKTLDYIHSVGIIHNDIKTDNILIEMNSNGNLTPILIDFGIALRANTSNTVSNHYRPSKNDKYRLIDPKYYGDHVKFSLAKETDFFSLRRTFMQPIGSPYLSPAYAVLGALPTDLKKILASPEPITTAEWAEFHASRKRRYAKNKILNCHDKYYCGIIKKGKSSIPFNSSSMDIDST